MLFFPLSILALAAGVYLLVKVKREYLGGVFEILAWLVILLSLVAIGFGGFRAMHHCGGKCNVEKRVMIMNGQEEVTTTCHKGGMMNGGTCPHMQSGGMMHGQGMMEGCAMGGCKMEGDSVVMDKATCEKMMGKEACDKMYAERGRCIVSKDECTKMCTAEGKACCMQGKTNATCPKTGTKTCCKK